MVEVTQFRFFYPSSGRDWFCNANLQAGKRNVNLDIISSDLGLLYMNVEINWI